MATVTTPTWQNVTEALPQPGVRVMLVNQQFPSGYPRFGVLRDHEGAPYWRILPDRINADFDTYDLWAYTGQPVNPHDPLYAQAK